MPHRYRVLVVVSVATFVASMDLFIVNIAFPSIERDFAGTSDATLSWVLSAYAIVTAALLIPAGRLADLLGRKRLFMGGLVTFVVASALCAAAPGAGWLIGARVVQAAGGAVLMPTSLALLLAEFSGRQRAVAVAIWSATGAVAAGAGPPIGGLLVQASWRWVFLVNLPIGLVTAVIAARILSESRDPEGKRFPDLAGAVMLVLASSALMLAIVQGQSWGWTSPRITTLFAGSVVLAAGFLYWSSRHPAPVLELGLFRARAFSAANISGTLFFAAFGAMLLASVLFLTRVWHEDILTAGLQIAPGPIAAAAFAVPGSLLSRRFGERTIAAIGSVLFAVAGLWWLRTVGLQPHYASEFLPGWLIGGAGVGFVIPTLASAAAAALPAARFATGSAVYGMTRQFGIALGIAILIAVLGTPRGAQVLPAFRTGWEVTVGLAFASAIAALAIGRIRIAPAQAEVVPELKQAV
ncbi:MAG: DHA2 family efflux MFS transporter permease subunit [Chloroflexi bacterium]|nr:MAG: DHA2 family efflux MFS transporter permease subunit [Chloroflexota bacterium]